ncbi:MAG: hypothetical protein RR322_02035 [Oscillospiraceae bacterium]
MSFKKIENNQTQGKWISDLADTPSIGATALKASFDKINKEVTIPTFNILVDELQLKGARDIGVAPILGIAANKVQGALSELKTLSDDRQSQFQNALSNKEPLIITKNTAFNKNFGDVLGTVCEGNDVRLSDARPASDVQAWAKTTNKPNYTAGEVGAYTKAEVYTKTQTDNLALTTLNDSKTYTDQKVVAIASADMQTAVYDKKRRNIDVFDYADSLASNKADKATTYTKTETYNKTEVDTSLSKKADKATTYLKTEVDSSLALKADKSTIPTSLPASGGTSEYAQKAVSTQDLGEFFARNIAISTADPVNGQNGDVWIKYS